MIFYLLVFLCAGIFSLGVGVGGKGKVKRGKWVYVYGREMEIDGSHEIDGNNWKIGNSSLQIDIDTSKFDDWKGGFDGVFCFFIVQCK